MPFDPAGRLELTGKEKLIHGEPAFEVQIKKPSVIQKRRLFAKPPKYLKKQQNLRCL